MGLMSALPVIGNIVDKGLGIVDDFVEDKDKANQLKAGIKRQIEDNTHEKDITELKSQAGIITAEATGESWLQRNWRPLLMLTTIIIVANNYVVYPYLSMFTDKATQMELRPEMWDLMKIGVGGYVVGRSGEKITKSAKGAK